jgi:predicted Zn finger-like uncharacterized protein
MTVTCPSCQTVYRIDPAKVPPGGVRARCAVCQAVFAVVAEPPAVAAPAPVQVPVREEPRAAAPPSAPPSPAPEPALAPAPAPHPAAPPARPAGPRPAGPPPAHAPAFAAPARGAGQPLAPHSGGAGAAVAAPSHPPAPGRPGAPVNPFLSQDPRQKARRLARALVSDIAVYHADRRREALRAGRLKEAFAEEIKKSWEEYTVQVGRDLAESTPFFTEALNEILAEGQPVF